MAEFHRKTRGIVVLHRCMLNPADGTFHDGRLYQVLIIANQHCASASQTANPHVEVPKHA